MPVKSSVTERRRKRLARREGPLQPDQSLSPGGATALPSEGLPSDLGGLDDLLTPDAAPSPTPSPVGMEEPLPEVPPTSPAGVPLRDALRGSPSVALGDQRPDESFNFFRKRVLSGVRGLIQTFASRPTGPLVVPVSPSVVALVSAWAAAGAPDDFSLNHNVLAGPPPAAGLVSLVPSESGDWSVSPVPGVGGPGIYFLVRESGENGGRQGLRAELIGAVRQGDFARAKEIASRAAASGLSDEDIDSAIDEALPDEQVAGDLSPAELIAAVSAAGPERRARLLPVLQSLLAGDPEFLSGDGRHPLRSHLGRIGLR